MLAGVALLAMSFAAQLASAQSLVVELAPWLERVGTDRLDGDLDEARPVDAVEAIDALCRAIVRLAGDEGLQPLTQPASARHR